MIKKIILILLCIINLATITILSTQSKEESRTLSRNVTRRIVEIQQKNTVVNEAIVDKQNTQARDFAHVLIFLLLGILLSITLNEFDIKYIKQIAIVLSICILYAVFDETYQKLLGRGRTFEVVDLLKDWAGSIIGIVVVNISYLLKNNI